MGQVKCKFFWLSDELAQIKNKYWDVYIQVALISLRVCQTRPRFAEYRYLANKLICY